jgi:hypothetical protein
MEESIYRALWKDVVLRAIEYEEFDVHVKNGAVYLNGHVVSTTSQNRIRNVLRAIPGILGIQDNLVPDDKLTLEIASSLGILEHTYGCKFSTGVSHGVVSLNGTVSDEEVRLLAETCAAGNPNVRGVINHVRLSAIGPELEDQRFLQPAIGENIYFLNGVSGVVKQVIINPNNRRVIAMTLQGQFTPPRHETSSLSGGTARLPQQLVTVPMTAVRYLTRVSGFLYMSSSERNRYADFDSSSITAPDPDWTPPYPYCPGDVLLPIEYQNPGVDLVYGPLQFPVAAVPEEASLSEQLLANDALGG